MQEKSVERVQDQEMIDVAADMAGDRSLPPHERLIAIGTLFLVGARERIPSGGPDLLGIDRFPAKLSQDCTLMLLNLEQTLRPIIDRAEALLSTGITEAEWEEFKETETSLTQIIEMRHDLQVMQAACIHFGFPKWTTVERLILRFDKRLREVLWDEDAERYFDISLFVGDGPIFAQEDPIYQDFLRWWNKIGRW